MSEILHTSGEAAPNGDRREKIKAKVIEITAEQMGVDKSQITEETEFVKHLNADSLDTVEIVMEFEDEFEISIPDEEAAKILSVGQAVNHLDTHPDVKTPE